MKIAFPFILSILITCQIFGQNNVDIRLSKVSQENKLHCYDLQLRTTESQSIALAGQNYRLFYDANVLDVPLSKIYSKLDSRAYTGLEIEHNKHNGIGFLSLSFDGATLNEYTLKLDPNKSWISVSNLCFESRIQRNTEITWANELTKDLASASITLSEWISENNQQPLSSTAYNTKLSFNDLSNGELLSTVKIFPNPVADFVQIELASNESKRIITVRDVMGRSVLISTINGGESKVIIDMTRLASGKYSLDISNDNNIYGTYNLIKSNRPY